MESVDKTPKQIVELLDQYVIGQNAAKKAIAVALRNRYRRMQLAADMQEEITPKNMLMIGPTGVGKTELARRLAKIVSAPFVKVEATKFTEVGYVGGDVESMVRNLVDVAVNMQKELQYASVRPDAVRAADKRLVKLLAPGIKKEKKGNDLQNMMSMLTNLQNGKVPEMPEEESETVTDEIRNQRLSIADQLAKGLLETREVTIDMDDPNQGAMGNNNMMNQMGIDLNQTLSQMMPKKRYSGRCPLRKHGKSW